MGIRIRLGMLGGSVRWRCVWCVLRSRVILGMGWLFLGRMLIGLCLRLLVRWVRLVLLVRVWWCRGRLRRMRICRLG